MRETARRPACAKVAIQALFISEFGHMYESIDEKVAGRTKDLFEEVLRDTKSSM